MTLHHTMAAVAVIKILHHMMAAVAVIKVTMVATVVMVPEAPSVTASKSVGVRPAAAGVVGRSAAASVADTAGAPAARRKL